jgi:aspartyl-tRNA(Asn)/glutamyl-tRNA(Gln) amidotransferase subunit C
MAYHPVKVPDKVSLKVPNATSAIAPPPLHRRPGAAMSAQFKHASASECSMEVDEGTVRRIARLARIKVSDQEVKALETELSAILDWAKQLDEVDVTDVEPMTRVVAMTLKKRADIVTDGEIAADIVGNAVASAGNMFVVPKVVE